MGEQLISGQKFKMVDGKQSSDWTIIQDGNSDAIYYCFEV